MNQRLTHISSTIQAFFASRVFFSISILIFAISSIFVATTSLYPMAFDEEFHLGLIKLYGEHLLPWSIPQSRELAVFGIAGADPSYLFHYLMSFPYRILSAVFSQDVTIILLRYINVALMIVALILFRAALRAFGMSRSISNTSIALFTLIPIAPLVAGQINYDNLLLLFTSASLYFTGRIYRTFISTHRLAVSSTWGLLIVILLGSATKYAYIPMALGIIVFLLIVSIRSFKRPRLRAVQRMITDFWLSTIQRTPKFKIILTALVIISTLLCARYVTNIVTYGNAVPSCSKVFDTDACLSYGPWQRDYYLEKNRDQSFQPLSLVSYAFTHWLPGMSERLTFAVAGPTNNYDTKEPLPVLQIGLIGLTIVSGLALIYGVIIDSRLRSQPLLLITVLMSLCYLAPLLLTLYKSYVTTAQPVAINGRYLLPLLPFITGCLIIGVLTVAQRTHLRRFIPLLTVLLIIGILFSGGGVLTYILLSNDSWFWHGWAEHIHAVLQNCVKLFVLH